MSSFSETFIHSTDDDPAAIAQRWLVERGDDVQAELAALATEVSRPALTPDDLDTAHGVLLRFCGDRLRRHCAVTYQTLYAAAARTAETRLLARALRTQHRMLVSHVDELKRAGSPVRIAEAAHALVAVLASNLDIERTVLLPALARSPGVGLAGLVADIATLDGGGELDISDVLDVRECESGRDVWRVRITRLADTA